MSTPAEDIGDMLGIVGFQVRPAGPQIGLASILENIFVCVAHRKIFRTEMTMFTISFAPRGLERKVAIGAQKGLRHRRRNM